MIGLALTSLSCAGDEMAPKPVIRPVRSVQAFASGGGRSRSFTGTSRAAIESRLSFKVSGTVEALPVKVGDSISKGDLIAQLDTRDFVLVVQEAEAALKSAEAQATQAASNYNRVERLWENRNASKNDLEAARYGTDSAIAQVQAARSRLEQAQSQLSYASLRSPGEGAVASLDVEENENVSPGQPIALLTSGSDLEVEVGIPEILIAQIREGDAVQVLFDAIQGEEFSAAIREVGVTSTEMATTFPVTVRLTQTHPDFRPGMAAEVRFLFGGNNGRDRILVPTVSVGDDRQGHFVFVLENEQNGLVVASRRSVTVGELTEHGLEILTGLSDGERIVTAGVSRIADGQTVRLMAD